MLRIDDLGLPNFRLVGHLFRVLRERGGVARVAVIRRRGCQAVQVARRRTSQMVAAMSSTDSASSQPPSIHWNGQKWLAGW
jgi:hypothetical protein